MEAFTSEPDEADVIEGVQRMPRDVVPAQNKRNFLKLADMKRARSIARSLMSSEGLASSVFRGFRKCGR